MRKYEYNLKKDSYDERDFKFSKLIKEKKEPPASEDLRSSYSDIKNQERLGACTAFSACSVMEYLLNKNIDLSELYFYYKERELDGSIETDAGSTVRQSAKVATKFGSCKEEIVPYITSKFADEPSEDANKDAANHRTKAYYRLNNIDEIVYTVGILKKPVLIGIDVYESFEQVDYNGYIPIPDIKREKLLGRHAVNICGYFWIDKTTGLSRLQRLIDFITRKRIKQKDGLYFIIRNSWGSDFADKGYMYAPVEFIKNYSFDWWYLDE